ncbi:MAG TPA: helix-turn-helix domain-containing protein [Polyangiaceae bacterium]|nr:helix-turn-helix domain-containing protein [Polyangiaceae bacterium]
MRAKIVLAAADGKPSKEVAKIARCSQQSVCWWRERFRVQGMAGLLDEPRPGAERRATDAKVEGVITKTLETTPTGQTHWSQRQMAKESASRSRPFIAFRRRSASSLNAAKRSSSPPIRSS